MTVLSLYEELLAPAERRSLPAGTRVVHVATGHTEELGVGETWAGTAELRLRAGDEGATLLRFELTEWEVEGAKLALELHLDPWAQYVLRCDRGGPRAPGIGCVLAGEVRVGGRVLGALDAWEEPAEPEGDGAILRVCVLPADDASDDGLATTPVVF